MPCRSDYLEPTFSENEQVSRKAKNLVTHSDKMTVTADRLRESILGKNFVIDPLITEGLEAMVEQGDKKRESLGSEYAYSYSNSARKAYEGYTKIRAQFVMLIKSLGGKSITSVDIKKIKKQQADHRKEDVQRLIQYWNKKGNLAEIAKLAAVDLDRALEPQIGYDPDKY